MTRPILFSTEMIKAILEGRKSQTRRAMKYRRSEDCKEEDFPGELQDCPDQWQPVCDIQAASFANEVIYPGAEEEGDENCYIDFISNPTTTGADYMACIKCPYGKPGDQLWVRETWLRGCEWDGDSDMPPAQIYYKADGIAQKMEWYDENREDGIRPGGPAWKPSIHMPKAAARIWLEITDVRVERVQQISEEDAVAEGVRSCQLTCGWDSTMYKDYMADASGYGDPAVDYPLTSTAVHSFSTLWQKINGANSWNNNSWVWVLKFRVLSTTGLPSHTTNTIK
jgi:hypothetical protein